MMNDGEIDGVEVSVSWALERPRPGGRVKCPQIHGEDRKALESAARYLRVGQEHPAVKLQCFI